MNNLENIITYLKNYEIISFDRFIEYINNNYKNTNNYKVLKKNSFSDDHILLLIKKQIYNEYICIKYSLDLLIKNTINYCTLYKHNKSLIVDINENLNSILNLNKLLNNKELFLKLDILNMLSKRDIIYIKDDLDNILSRKKIKVY